MGHSQFEKIPISKERQERLLHEQIWEITEGIAEVEASGGERFTVKQLERTKKSLEARLEKLQAEDRKDDVVTFEQLGVDRLFVDEAHNYKNLFLYTKMRNVAGLSTTDAQKSSDMFAKCRYMDEITGGRGVVFATGTPVSNSMTELYTMQRYLQYDRLQELGMAHFDCWASRFGETVTALELAPEGTGYRARTRFSKFFNLPELMNLFKEVADIKTADQLHLPTPEVEYHNIVAQPTAQQQEMVKALSERASLVHSGTVDPSPVSYTQLAHQSTELREDTVQLLPTGMSYPIDRVESRERFEQLLRADNRNDFYTEFLPVNPEDVYKRQVLPSSRQRRSRKRLRNRSWTRTPRPPSWTQRARRSWRNGKLRSPCSCILYTSGLAAYAELSSMAASLMLGEWFD